MIERGGGVIVNMASVAAERGAAGRAPYATTKHAVVGLTRSAGGRVGAARRPRQRCRPRVRRRGRPQRGDRVGHARSGATCSSASPQGRLADPDEIADDGQLPRLAARGAT